MLGKEEEEEGGREGRAGKGRTRGRKGA